MPVSKAPDAVVRKDVSREILLSFWKIHILHHAAEGPVVGQWMLEELRRHGYEVSPGTLYPVLRRMTMRGWLRCEFDPRAGSRARRDYYLTARGRAVLQTALTFLAELRGEVMPSAARRRRS
jgi:PadR family transcriptional regulator PadR